MIDRLKLIRLILYPFLVFSLTIYFCLYGISPLKLAYQIALIIGSLLTLIVFYLEKPNWRQFFKFIFNWEGLLLLVPVIFVLLAFYFVLSPLVKIIIVQGNPILGLTSLGDYYKHLYILSSIKNGGLPPYHPFFPSANLSYYYGYYLLPSAVSSVFNFDLARVFFVYLFLTTFLLLFVIVQLTLSAFRSWYQRLLAVVLFIFGTGLDIIPTLIEAKQGILTANHIEFWSQILNLSNYLVNNLYTALLWVPQHCFTALIVFVTGITLLKEKKISILWLTLAIWFCLISSTFVSVSLILWLGLFFLLIPHTRLRLFISGALALVFLYPYLSELVGRGSILSFGFYMTPFRYLSLLPYWVDCVLTFFTEYGLILISIPAFFVIYRQKNQKEATLITLAVSFPILLGLFVKSSGFNDYSMRSVLPSQMALPFLMAYSLEKVERSVWKKTIFLLLMLNFILSMTGFFYEIHFRLLDIGSIDARTSELLLSLRKTPVQNLAAIDNEDWVYLIPSYGYQSIYSPRLFDSNGYLSNTGLAKQSVYANSVDKLFIDETLAKTYTEDIYSRLDSLQAINQFFAIYKNFSFIIPKYHGTKSAINPWFKIMQMSGADDHPITDSYSIFKGEDVSSVLSHQKISLNLNGLKNGWIDSNNQLYLSQGLWFIVGCDRGNIPELKLEFTDYYVLFDKKNNTGQAACAGVIYYQPINENVAISKTSLFSSIYLVPLTVIRESL